MSAIDNAFIRAYTLDATAAAAPGARDDDEQAAPYSVGPRVAESQGFVAKASPAAARISHRTARSANSIAVATSDHSSSSAAVAPANRSATAVATRTTKTSRGSAEPVVPTPHFRMDSFIHTTTTLESSAQFVTSAILEAPKPEHPGTEFDSPEAESSPQVESLMKESPVVESLKLFSNAPEMYPPEFPSDLPVGFSPLSPSPPPTPPFLAAVAAPPKSATEAPRAELEVDRFTWPDLCNSLLEKQTAEFDQLVGQLVTESALGRKVVAITGSRRGNGRTTLALSLARRLAATSVKVVVVDADFEVPQLAARLGMTIQSGWGKILSDGLPVWDALVESLHDGVVLLPLAPRQAAGAGQPTATEFVARHREAIRQHLDTLRNHFDVIIVDAGTVKAVRPDAKPRGPLALAGCLDSAIMVSDARTASPDQLADLHRRLQESRIVPLGIAENFCP